MHLYNPVYNITFSYDQNIKNKILIRWREYVQREITKIILKLR